MATQEATCVLKKELRKRIRDALRALPSTQRAAESVYLFNRLKAHQWYKGADAVALYTSMPTELNTYDMLRDVLASNKRLFLPRVIAKETREMAMLEVRSLAELDTFPRGAYSIPEPPMDGRPRAPHDVKLDLIVVPGVAFDLRGGRCGNGMGYYDVFLAHYQRNFSIPMPKLLAFGLSPQIVTHVPVDETDWLVDEVITAPGCHPS